MAAFSSSESIAACSAARPLPHFAGEGWGGGRICNDQRMAAVMVGVLGQGDVLVREHALNYWSP